MATTEILPFATAGGANVESQASYAADSTTSEGFLSGVAPSAKLNKVWRQSSFIAAAIANWLVGQGISVPDDGNLNALLTNLNATIAAQSACQQELYSSSVATGTADALIGAFTPAITSTILATGTTTLFVRAASANATATPTFTPKTGTISPANIVKGNNLPLAAGDIAGAGHWLLLQWDTTLLKWVLLNPATGISNSNVSPRSFLSGYGMSTAGSSTTMSIAAGAASDSTNSNLITLAAAIAKTTGAWAVGNGNGGIDTGSIANSTWYYFYAILRPDTGVVDVIFSLSSSAPTLPTNYTKYRYIGAGYINSSGNWNAFTQMGREFYWATPSLDFSGAGSTTSALLTLAVPSGRKMKAFFNIEQQASTIPGMVYLSDPANADVAPSSTVAPLASVYSGTGSSLNGNTASCWTNNSAQIRHREGDAATWKLATLGWIDLADTNL